MKTKRLYQSLTLAFAMLLGIMNGSAQNYVKTFTFNFAPEDFRIEQIGTERKCEFVMGLDYTYGELEEPALPHISYDILLPDNYKIHSFTYSMGDDTCRINRVLFYPTAEDFGNGKPDTLTVDSIPLYPTPLVVSGSDPYRDAPPYPLQTFPSNLVHEESYENSGYELEKFTICPFTYYAVEQKLVLATSVTLTLTIEPDSGSETSGERDESAVETIKRQVHNPEDVETGVENWTPVSMAATEFSTTGTKWYSNYHYENFMFGNSSYENTTICYELGTDTLIDGQTWKAFLQNDKYCGAIREQDGQVWFYPSDKLREIFGFSDGVPTMLYDFTLQAGDTLYYRKDYAPGFTREKMADYEDYYYDYFIVRDVREEYGRKVIDFGHEQWIEGVGSVQSAFFDQWVARATNGSNSWETVIQVVSEGKTIYFNGEVANPDAKLWLKEGMTWTQGWSYDGDSEEHFRQIMLNEEGRPGTFPISMSDDSHLMLLFDYLQDFNGKVFAIGDGHIELCYDFTVQEGDKVSLLLSYFFQGLNSPVLKYDTCTVSKVDSIEIGGVMRKRITLTGDREDVWVEGIGSLTRPFPIDGIDTFSSTLFGRSLITCLYDNENQLYLHPEYANCTTKRTAGIQSVGAGSLTFHPSASTLTCTSPDAVKLEVYTLDAVKVGEARFTNGQATVKVNRTPATYLYIVTYPDGRRESGKTRIN